MAVDLSKLVSKRKITLDDLKDRVIAVDAWNILYQFLSIIRGPDGNPLRDIHGNVTSHLSGVFYRNIELISHGISPVYVFDGVPSMLKQKTIEARMNRKKMAQEAFEKAVAEGRMEEAKMYAQGTVHMTKEILDSAKKLMEFMGIPYINALRSSMSLSAYFSILSLLKSCSSHMNFIIFSLFGSARRG